MIKTYTIFPKSKIRLDDFLRKELPSLLKKEVSNSKIRRLIVAGAVIVRNSQIRKPSFILGANDSVELRIDEDKVFYEKTNNDIDFVLTQNDVLYEDDLIIVVNKPYHLPTEAGMVKERGNLHACVVDYLFKKQKIEQPNLKNPPYVGIMHRLDRDTSGVILFTKKRDANSFCHDMFENHTAKKTYIAKVSFIEKSQYNKFSLGKTFAVEFPMARISAKSQAAKWGRSAMPSALNSRTEFTVLKVNKNFMLVECRPLTGRTHQIRVHLSYLNIPIEGDILYGGVKNKRIMLHAKSLSFEHPKTKKMLTIESPVSADFYTGFDD